MRYNRVVQIPILMIAALLCWTVQLDAQPGQNQKPDKAAGKSEMKKANPGGRDQTAAPRQGAPETKGRDADKPVKAKEQEAGDDVRGGSQKQEPPQKEARDMEQEQEKARDKEQEKAGKGNAYGKNKGDLEGREFGQARAEAARAKHAEKKARAQQAVTDGEAEVAAGRQKIKEAKEKLEKDRKGRKISNEEAAAKEAKIKKAEEEVDKLEKSVEEAKKQMERSGSGG